MKREIIDITPDISLFPKIGRSGYSLTQSIAELVDNSIDARILGLTLKINIVLQNNFIIVENNGTGMDSKMAETALVLGHSTKRDALGEFGLGLKSACTSLGKMFTLETSKSSSKVGYRYQYDEKRWLSKIDKRDWTDERIVFEKNLETHGTKIKIERGGIKNPKIDTVIKFAKALDVSLDDLKN